MAPSHPLHTLRQLAGRLLPTPPVAFERPAFAAPAFAAFGLGIVLLMLQSWPPSLFFAPSLGIGCRYYELARFRTVRRSHLVLLLTIACAITSTLWALTHRSLGFEQPLTLALAIGSLATAWHLFSHQKRLLAAQAATNLLDVADEDGPLWSCGGPLAILPVLLLVGSLSGIAAWGSPATMLWGLSGIAVFAAQLRRHRWFPRLATTWLLVWLGIETLATFTSSGDAGDDALATYCVVVTVLGSIVTYLLCSARVRRTFQVEASVATTSAPEWAGAPRERRVAPSLTR